MRSRRWLHSSGSGCLVRGLALFAVLGITKATGFAQSDPPPSGSSAGSPETQAAVIERLPLVLRDPKSYQTPLSLKPAVSIELVARADGIVASLQTEVGKQVSRQAEVVRMDDTESQLQVARAKAALQAAQTATGEQATPLIDVAKLDVQIAEHRLARTIVLAPFDGTITAIHVVPGQFVRAGDPLARLSNLQKLTVSLPVDRNAVSVGGSLEIKVEDQTASGQVSAIEPLAARFEPLRELFLSVATAVVTIDNGGGRFKEGQTVYSNLIPQAPVSEIPTIAVGSNVQGERRVQVIREGFVRDVPVSLLGQAGQDYVFVTGRFGASDELVVKSSKELRDGMRVLPAATAEPDADSNRSRNPPGSRMPSNF